MRLAHLCEFGSIKDNKMTHNMSKARSYLSAPNDMKFGVVFEVGFIAEIAILPHLSRCCYIVRSRCYTGSNWSKEKEARVKDHRKNGASKRVVLALVPFFA